MTTTTTTTTTTTKTIPAATGSGSSESQLHAVAAESLSTMVRDISTKEFEASDKKRQGMKILSVSGCEVDVSKMRRPLLIKSPPKFKDKHIWEQIVNIVTCIPFALVGRKVAKRGKYSKLYKYSMCGTALAAGLYHSSEHPKLRNPLRRLDYCTIAASAVAFTLAVRERETPKALLALTAAAIPFQPILVMACHVAEAEVRFAAKAIKDPSVRKQHLVHLACGIGAGASFLLEDTFPDTPYLHAAWHLGSALSSAIAADNLFIK